MNIFKARKLTMWLYHLIKESLVACFILQALYAGASVTKFDDLSSYFTISLICLVPEVVALILAIVMTIGGDGKRISIGQMIVDLVFEVLFIGFAAIAFTTVAEGDLPFPQAIEGLFFLFVACTVFFIILSVKAIKRAKLQGLLSLQYGKEVNTQNFNINNLQNMQPLPGVNLEQNPHYRNYQKLHQDTIAPPPPSQNPNASFFEESDGLNFTVNGKKV